MRLRALVHLSRAVLEMSDVERIVVFGSASLLANFPELGDEDGSPIQLTFDADMIPFPFEEDLGVMLHEAFGDGRKFHQHFGYHADIIRPKVTEQFPEHWEDRLVALPGVERVVCLDPHDMAAAKCRVGRPKDAKQVGWLVKRGLLDLSILRDRLREISIEVRHLVPGHALLDLLEKNFRFDRAWLGGWRTGHIDRSFGAHDFPVGGWMPGRCPSLRWLAPLARAEGD